MHLRLAPDQVDSSSSSSSTSSTSLVPTFSCLPTLRVFAFRFLGRNAEHLLRFSTFSHVPSASFSVSYSSFDRVQLFLAALEIFHHGTFADYLYGSSTIVT